jgi:hypothetical protein
VKATNDSDKYKIVLKLVNKILINIGKEEVDDLTKFVDIDREDIIKEVNKNALVGMEGELFPLFNKNKVGYYRTAGNSYVLNCLRGLLKDIGYEMNYKQKDKSEIMNGKSFRRKHFFYFIN